MEAQYKVGVSYDIGWGVDEDQDEAFEWYLKAAEQGQNLAKLSLKKFKN